jgi:hypothetical protein
MDTRLLSYYGGFLDPAIEGFHHAFGFPNEGRQYFLQDKMYINIPNNNGIALHLDRTTVAFGDIDFWGKYTVFENKYLSLAGAGAFKIPSGRLDTLSGSNYPDLGFEALADIRALWWLTFYTQAGMVVPFNGKSYVMFNGLAGIEFNAWQLFSPLIQMNIKTSPISSKVGHYSMPQTNILAGFIFQHRGFKWQFYVEEDAFTNQGTDITFNFMFSQSISIKKFHHSH